MDINKIRDKKVKLESDIETMLQTFTLETGLHIDGVEFNTIDVLTGVLKTYVVTVKVSV